MLRSRARGFTERFGRKGRKGRPPSTQLRMQTFLERDLSEIREENEDDIDCGVQRRRGQVELHQSLLMSSDTDDGDLFSSDENDLGSSEEVSNYELNHESGEWIGMKQRTPTRTPKVMTAPVHSIRSFFSKKKPSALYKPKSTSVNFDGSDVRLLTDSSSDEDSIV